MSVLPILLLAVAPHWRLSTADTVASISVAGNRPIIQELRSTADGSAWAHDTQVNLIDRVWVGGREEGTRWKYVRGNSSADGTTVRLTFANAEPPLELRSIWRARPGRGPIEHRIEIVNRSSSAVAVPEQDSLDLRIHAASDASAWWIQRGASNALTEGGVFNKPISPQLNLNLVSDHHNERSPVPWLAVQEGDRRGLYLGWEFSGLGGIDAKGVPGGGADVRVGLLPNFKTDILPHSTLEIPAAFVGCYRGTLDDGSQELHRFILEKLRAKTPASFPDPPLILGLYLDAGADHALEADVLRCERFAKSIGFEVFMPDAMWFPACGDWRWDPARFPHGSQPIESATHGDGMKFGLWCAWDNGGVSSAPGALSVRGPVAHPDWFPYDPPANWQPGPFYGMQADMGCEPAREWAIAKTQQMARDYKLDMLKTDVHPMINECSRTDHRHGYGTDVSYWSALGVYKVWDRLRAAYPGVVLENCSGASHIKDFGVIQRCAYTATTDTLSNLPDRAGIYDSTFVLPPSALLTYTYENGYGLPGDEPGPYLARSAMMTAWNMAPTNSKGWTPEMLASIKACAREYKEWVRPIQRDCVVHHVMPRPDGKHWDGMFFWSPRLDSGSLFVFRPDSGDDRQTVKLAGLNARASYRVWGDDGSISPTVATGRQLMSSGVALRLADRYTSDLVHVQDAAKPKPAGWIVPRAVRDSSATSTADYFRSSASFQWRVAPGARSYRLLISKRPDMRAPVVETVVYAPAFEVDSLESGGAYYYRIDSLGWGGSADGQVGRFTEKPRHAFGGSFVSDLPWQRATIGVPEGPWHDRNHYGNELSIGGRKMPKGVWTHSFDDGRPADIDIDLVGRGFGRFVATTGLDDASGGGSVQFEVLLDGKVVAQSPVLRPREVHEFDVDVTGARVLTLRVLNGGDGYNSDHSVWGMARLLKPGANDPFR